MPDETPGSPEDWRNRLLAKLSERAQKVEALEKYYDGEHPLPEPPRGLDEQTFQEARKAYVHLCRLGLTNWVKLVADAPAERLGVVGFRFGGDASSDSEAWDIWQANFLDADSALVHDNALQTGNSFAMVWPGANEPEITCEHSGQVIVAYESGSRRRRRAALKAWIDDKTRYSVLYTPTGVYKWTAPNNDEPLVANQHSKWQRWVPDTDAEWGFANPMRAVPLVEFRANAKLKPSPFGGGRGEFEGVLSIQQRINKVIFDRLVTGEFQAFRQRYAIGWEIPVDPVTGKEDPRAVARAGASRLWTIDADPNEVTLGEFAQSDFTGFIKACEADINALAAISKTPPHYLLGAMVNISGDALKAAESGLSSKTAKHRDQFSESWEEVMRLAFRAKGDEVRGNDTKARALWKPVEVRTVGEMVDAIVKMQALGVPQEACWQMLPDVTPQDIERWKVMLEEQSLRTPPTTVNVVAGE